MAEILFPPEGSIGVVVNPTHERFTQVGEILMRNMTDGVATLKFEDEAEDNFNDGSAEQDTHFSELIITHDANFPIRAALPSYLINNKASLLDLWESGQAEPGLDNFHRLYQKSLLRSAIKELVNECFSDFYQS